NYRRGVGLDRRHPLCGVLRVLELGGFCSMTEPRCFVEGDDLRPRREILRPLRLALGDRVAALADEETGSRRRVSRDAERHVVDGTEPHVPELQGGRIAPPENPAARDPPRLAIAAYAQ